MNKKLIIDSGNLSYSISIKIVDKYIENFSYMKTEDGLWGLKFDIYLLKTTNKYPETILLNNNKYYLHCKENKNSFKLTIWRG
jgi:hypothetical protein